MRARRRFQRYPEEEQRTPVPAYLLPPEASDVVFDPTLRRAGDILREA
jgi:hypothetical protein